MDKRRLQYRQHTDTLWHGLFVGVFQDVQHIFNPSLKRYKAKSEPMGAAYLSISTPNADEPIRVTIDEAKAIIAELSEALKVVEEGQQCLLS